MKKKIALLITLSLAISAIMPLGRYSPLKAFATMAIEKVNLTTCTLKADAVNLREGPGTNFPIVCTLKKGDSLKILGKVNGWYVAFEPKKGCVGMVFGKFVNLGTQTNTNAPTPKKTPTPKQTPKSTNTTSTKQPSPDLQSGLSQDEQTLLDLINKKRVSAGITALKVDMNIMKTARLKAKDMVDNNYFSHQSPTYGSPFDMMRQFGIIFNTAGENIAGNQTIQGAVNAWMNSEDHRKNILNGNFNYTGVGIVSSPTYGKILVQQFVGR